MFSVERLEQHAESLAAGQNVTARPKRGRSVSRRLRANARIPLGAYRVIAAAIREERAVTPAAEWLVDNFHIVDGRMACREADALTDRPLEKGAGEVVLGRTELRRLAQGSFSREFTVQLIQRLRDHDPSVMPFVAWLDANLEDRGANADELVREEHLRQGAMNVADRKNRPPFPHRW